MRAPVTFSSKIDVRVSAAKLWPLVSDTERINRAMGHPDIAFETIPQVEGGSIRKADMKVEPLHVRWQEMPFEWVRNEGFSVERVYESGPFELADLWRENRMDVLKTFLAATQVGILGSSL